MVDSGAASNNADQNTHIGSSVNPGSKPVGEAKNINDDLDEVPEDEKSITVENLEQLKPPTHMEGSEYTKVKDPVLNKEFYIKSEKVLPANYFKGKRTLTYSGEHFNRLPAYDK